MECLLKALSSLNWSLDIKNIKILFTISFSELLSM